jgi:hypothetical protein
VDVPRTDRRPEPPAAPVRRARRSLAHVGGEVETRGDADLAAVLARSLAVLPATPTAHEAERDARPHVHGFHPYPARLHPSTAAHLVGALAPESGVVLDPFCGSGTVLVEARAAKREAWGFDLNPVAVALSKLKTRSFRASERESILAASERACAVATERRLAKQGASRRYSREDVAHYDPHVLLELDGLRVGIEGLGASVATRVAQLVLSSILTKLSRRDGDTGAGLRKTRLAAGYPTRLFMNKTKELVTFLELTAQLYQGAPSAHVLRADARLLHGAPDGGVDLVVSSPPYPGVYDYVEHHRARMRWLGMDPDPLDAGEIGARRALVSMSPREAADAFEKDMAQLFGSCRRVLRARGRVALIVADGASSDVPLLVDELCERAARTAGLSLAAAASQERPHFHGASRGAFRSRPRREHVLLFG